MLNVPTGRTGLIDNLPGPDTGRLHFGFLLATYPHLAESEIAPAIPSLRASVSP